MADDTKRPEIYDYLDNKFGEVYKKFDNTSEEISGLKSEFKSFSDKERPLKICRDHIEAVTANLERRKANKFPSAVWSILIGVIILGSYAYTTLVWSKVGDAIDRNSNAIQELTNVIGRIK